ncbi:hypothetical protein [Mycoplasma seminis]|uniref:Uncharacterized protein n=1 Tax=Mycoplasma seminis TaxID=512749 RepID=A0ABY9H9X9_9MOLU|nr:hypothetical protein [Mycoplasma seminis]WLP85221.1 hypothetical protein Q8852_02775 [Mycoplasma seminis]
MKKKWWLTLGTVSTISVVAPLTTLSVETRKHKIKGPVGSNKETYFDIPRKINNWILRFNTLGYEYKDTKYLSDFFSIEKWNDVVEKYFNYEKNINPVDDKDKYETEIIQLLKDLNHYDNNADVEEFIHSKKVNEVLKLISKDSDVDLAKEFDEAFFLLKDKNIPVDELEKFNKRMYYLIFLIYVKEFTHSTNSIYKSSFTWEILVNNIYNIMKFDLHNWQSEKDKIKLLSDETITKLQQAFKEKIISDYKRNDFSKYEAVPEPVLLYIREFEKLFDEIVSQQEVITEYKDANKQIPNMFHIQNWDKETLLNGYKDNLKQFSENIIAYFKRDKNDTQKIHWELERYNLWNKDGYDNSFMDTILKSNWDDFTINILSDKYDFRNKYKALEKINGWIINKNINPLYNLVLKPYETEISYLLNGIEDKYKETQEFKAIDLSGYNKMLQNPLLFDTPLRSLDINEAISLKDKLWNEYNALKEFKNNLPNLAVKQPSEEAPKDEVSNLETLEEVNNAIDTKNNEVAKLLDDIASLKAQVQQLQKDNEANKEKIAELEDTLKLLVDELLAKEKQLGILKDKKATLEAKYAVAEKADEDKNQDNKQVVIQNNNDALIALIALNTVLLVVIIALIIVLIAKKSKTKVIKLKVITITTDKKIRYTLQLLDNGRLVGEFKQWLQENKIYEIQDLKEKLDISLREYGTSSKYAEILGTDVIKELKKHSTGFMFLGKKEKQISSYALEYKTFLKEEEVLEMFFTDNNIQKLQNNLKGGK